METTDQSPEQQTTQGYGYDGESGEYDDLSDLTSAEPCLPVVAQRFLRIFAPVLYSVVLLLGVAGNGMVVVVISRCRGPRRTATDTFLLQLAVADLLLALTLPFWAAEALVGWYFGTVLCKLVGAVFALNLYSGLLLLVCISFDRYLAIVHAVHMYKRRRPAYLHAACLTVWALCALLAAVDLAFRDVFDSKYLNGTVCTYVFPAQNADGWKLALRLTHQVLGFCLPVAVMVYCYGSIFKTVCGVQLAQRQRTLRVVVAVVTVFLGCWTPYHVVLFLDTLQGLGALSDACDLISALDIGRPVTQGLGLAHSCLNPLIYALIGVRFRREATRLLARIGCPCARGGDRRAMRGTRGKRGSSGISASETSTTYSTLW
ncbi:C-X-C chemokine receptor type 3-like [Hypanus sabinus]|uniref:C-X-C chemokine receptor type 3-like n=1 Tax=Hypanus sabinus TaxID=79690 RepID=UPI0028C4C4E9|nr:C-X-C chemokine receptor type 3-like [Hypanus sabinus]